MRTRLLAGTRGVVLALVLCLAGSPSFAQTRRGEDAVERLETGSFLVASRELQDPNFRQTVVLIVEYDRWQGALGLVINRPSEVELSHVMPRAEGSGVASELVFVGGPVEPLQFALLVRSPEAPQEARPVFDDVYFSNSLELLERLIDEPVEDGSFRTYAGYSGWAPGQLETEIAVGGWHVVAGQEEAIFEHPSDKVWSRLILLGTADWARLGSDVAP